MQEHIESLRRHIEQGTLIRGKWTGTDEQGRHTVCLLAAMVPQCGSDQSASACPADVMPMWLAHLTPRLDDNGSDEAWPGMVKRFASLAARWHTLDVAAWQRVQFTWLAAVVRDAAKHTTDPAAVCICNRVAALCDGVATTGAIGAALFGSARREAWDVWSARAAAAAVEAAVEAAEAAAWAAEAEAE